MEQDDAKRPKGDILRALVTVVAVCLSLATAVSMLRGFASPELSSIAIAFIGLATALWSRR
ncbi:MAG TPA: hypothetical protein VGE07_25490 [Herpetosiphonaceae bacterium]